MYEYIYVYIPGRGGKGRGLVFRSTNRKRVDLCDILGEECVGLFYGNLERVGKDAELGARRGGS